ncbi:MAG: DUF433 domain-containing protein [Chloroflexota bacterium]
MDTITLQPHLTVLQSWQDGSIRVGNSRVLLDLVIFAFNEGRTPEEIVLQFPVLKLAEVYSAIAYYLENREQIDTYLDNRAKEAEKLWANIESDPNQQALRQKLLAKKSNS